ncbi:MAG: hypothetical protein ACXWP4_02610 [Polyangiales bacterium]
MDPMVDAGSGRREPAGFTVRVVGATSIAGARVAYDAGDGSEPLIVVTDGEGRAVFRGLAPSHAAFTAYAEDHAMTSLVDVSGATSDERVLALERRPNAAGFVTISGTLRGKTAAGNFVTITSPQGDNVFEDTTAAYSVRVRAGQPLTFVALEWTKNASSVSGWDETKVRWLRFEHSAVASDVTFDLDLHTATPLASTKVNVSMSVPPGNTLGGPPLWQVQAVERQAPSPLLGSRSHVARIAANAFSAAGELVELSPEDFHPYTYAVAPGLEGELAEASLDGMPAFGTTIDFLAFPEAPEAASLTGKVVLPLLDETIDGVRIVVVDELGPSASALWSIVAAGRPTTISMPKLPSDARALLPAKPYARLMVKSGALPQHADIPARTAWSAFFGFEP